MTNQAEAMENNDIMKAVINWLLVICALVLIVPLFIWCLCFAVVKKIKGDKPDAYYDRYVEE